MRLHRTSLFREIPVDDIYNRQRKKDADVVRSENQELMNRCRFGKDATMLDAIKLTAEYQALIKRQAGHGRIWRFFHSKQNEQRTQLLDDMKNAIDTITGGAILTDRPLHEIANTADRLNIDRRVRDGFFSE